MKKNKQPDSLIKDDIFNLEGNLFSRLIASHPSLTELNSTINFCNHQLLLTDPFLARATKPSTVERYDLNFDELVLGFFDFQAIIMIGLQENHSFANLINNFKNHSLKRAHFIHWDLQLKMIFLLKKINY